MKKIIILCSFFFILSVFKINRCDQMTFSPSGCCIHGGFQKLYKPIYSPNEKFTVVINSSDGLAVTDNNTHKRVLIVDNVEINDFGFSADSRYFFIDYLAGAGLKTKSKPSIDVFDLYIGQKILTVSQYSLFACSRRRIANACDLNDFIKFESKSNNIAISCQAKNNSKTIAEMYGVSLVKYHKGDTCFACFFKSGFLKVLEIIDFEVKELFVFLPYSHQNPGKSFYKP